MKQIESLPGPGGAACVFFGVHHSDLKLLTGFISAAFSD